MKTQAPILVILLTMLSSISNAANFNEATRTYVGDLNNDGHNDIFVDTTQIVLLHGDIITPIVISTVNSFVLLQNPDQKTFTIKPSLSSADRSKISQWAEIPLRILLGDYNADGWIDVLLKGVEELLGPRDVILYAEPEDGTQPLYIASLDEGYSKFIDEISNWMQDPGYFIATAGTVVFDSIVSTEILYWCYIGEVTQAVIDSVAGVGQTVNTDLDSYYQGVTSGLFNGNFLSCLINGGNIFTTTGQLTYRNYRPYINYSLFQEETVEVAGVISEARRKAAIDETDPQIAEIFDQALEVIIRTAVRNGNVASILVRATVETIKDKIEQSETGMDPDRARVLVVLSETICAQAQSRNTTVEGREQCIAGIEELLDGAAANGDLDEDNFDFDKYALLVEGLKEATKARREDPNGRHCTYILKNATAPIQRYYGKTSGNKNESCEAIADRRYLGHVWAKSQGFTIPPDVDRLSDGRQGYIDITGREQQLVDSHVFDRNPPALQGLIVKEIVRNRRRPVGKRNILGCVYWLASDAKFGNIAPYTGKRLPTQVGCDNVPVFP